MKPVVMFWAVGVTLIAGAVVSRLANAGDVATYRRSSNGAEAKARMLMRIQLTGELALGEGEGIALSSIVNSTDANPNALVEVDWTESYHGRLFQRRATYDPRDLRLHCVGDNGASYDYQPVAPKGIRAALQNRDAAAFADANLYSMPRAIEQH